MHEAPTAAIQGGVTPGVAQRSKGQHALQAGGRYRHKSLGPAAQAMLWRDSHCCSVCQTAARAPS